jgi:hypothetical protein
MFCDPRLGDTFECHVLVVLDPGGIRVHPNIEILQSVGGRLARCRVTSCRQLEKGVRGCAACCRRVGIETRDGSIDVEMSERIDTGPAKFVDDHSARLGPAPGEDELASRRRRSGPTASTARTARTPGATAACGTTTTRSTTSSASTTAGCGHIDRCRRGRGDWRRCCVYCGGARLAVSDRWWRAFRMCHRRDRVLEMHGRSVARRRWRRLVSRPLRRRQIFRRMRSPARFRSFTASPRAKRGAGRRSRGRNAPPLRLHLARVGLRRERVEGAEERHARLEDCGVDEVEHCGDFTNGQ